MPFTQPSEGARAEFDVYNDVAGNQTNDNRAINSNDRIKGGKGGKGARVSSQPFKGDLSQLWNVEAHPTNNAQLAVSSAETCEYLTADPKTGALAISPTEQHWQVVRDGPGYKLVMPGSNLAITLGDVAGLVSLSDKDTNQSLHILADTKENREAIKQGRIVPPPVPTSEETAKPEPARTAPAPNMPAPINNQAPVASSQAPATHQCYGGVNLTINHLGGPSAPAGDTSALAELQKFLASDVRTRNLVIFLGTPSPLDYPVPARSSTEKFDELDDSPAAPFPTGSSGEPYEEPLKLQLPSADFCHVKATDSGVASKIWFMSKDFDQASLGMLVSVQLSTVARDQGFSPSSDDGSWTWFEIVILTSPFNQSPKIVGGRSLKWFSHCNKRAVSSNTKLWGPKFEKSHEMFEYLEPGNILVVRVCAQYEHWENFAEIGHLHLEFRAQIGS
ncbi:unnamed protein product [Cyclocybe aegerita]|uniref:Uncharacterized protein n=1 Tax=Cyclocybe aegerita TaxID=1973307 RepID=A0A8S0VY70_CYCAE|nr:unnamed protein product [Cyclocybe aegerita]